MSNLSRTLIICLTTLLAILLACKKEQDPKIVSLEVKALPNKIEYIVGDAFDYTGLIVTLNMDDGSKKEVKYAGFDNEQIFLTEGAMVNSSVEIKIIHEETGLEAHFTFVILDKAVEILSIKNLPLKTNYIEGERLDLTGLIITLTYNNDDTEDVALADFENAGIVTSHAQDTVINSEMDSIEIIDMNTQAKAGITLTVNAVMGVALVTGPNKYEYYFGETFDLSTLEIVLVLDNSQSSATIPLNKFINFGISTMPEHGMVIGTIFDKLEINHAVSGKSISISPYIIHEFLTDIDNNTYKIVRVGENVWMAENLKVTHYANGTAIPLVGNDADWKGPWDDPFKGYCYYNNNENSEEETYGALYSFDAAVNGIPYVEVNVQGVCPTGWHVPSSSEWEMIGGGNMNGAIRLKESGDAHWGTSNNGTDYYGFAALPGGERNDNGFSGLEAEAYFWSSKEINTNYAVGYNMSHSNDYFYFGTRFKNTGYSIRCVKDKD